MEQVRRELSEALSLLDASTKLLNGWVSRMDAVADQVAHDQRQVAMLAEALMAYEIEKEYR